MTRGAAVGPVAVLAAACLVGAGLTAAQASAPRAEVHEAYPVPASGVFTVEGHGWGHGYGMSQWGAAEAASQGVPYDQILSFYYPGASTGSIGNPTIAVALTGVGAGSQTVGYTSGSARYQCADASVPSATCSLDVDATSGLVVTDTASGAHPDSIAGVTAWRVTVAADGLHLAAEVSGAWRPATIGGASAVTGPVTFASGEFVRVDYGSTQRDYRGVVSAARTTAAGASPARMIRLDTLSLDDYVRGVVYRESLSSWPLAALEAQAVASRSYAASYRADSRAAHRAYDICDTTACQVFGGSRLVKGGTSTWLEPDPDNPATDPVAQTAGRVLLDSTGAPVFAEFGASNGGWTAGSATSDTPRYDTWDDHSADPRHDWTTTLSAASLADDYGFARLDQLVVTARDGTTADWGGRVRAVELDGVDATGAAKTVTVTGQSALRFGMRSTFWHITDASAASPVTITGPSTARRGSTITIRGTAPAGATVTVGLKWQGAGAFAALTPITADGDGTWSRRLWMSRDATYRATAAGVTTASVTTDVTGTTISAPATSPEASKVTVHGYAEPGSKVTLYLERGTAAVRSAGSVTANGRGAYAIGYTLTADTAAYTVAADVRSATVTTRFGPTVAGPRTAHRGDTYNVTGLAKARARVELWTLAQGAHHYVRRAVLTADRHGRFSTTLLADVDYHYYAVASGRRSAHGLTRAEGTTALGPGYAAKGTVVPLHGLAAPGSRVVVQYKPAGATAWRSRNAVLADSRGRWRGGFLITTTTAWRAVSDHSYSRTGTTRLS